MSEGELRVLRLLPGEPSYREVAGELSVSRNTVCTHAGPYPPQARRLDAGGGGQPCPRR
jgi:hypothetical protein